jgi:hypothetical protein
LFQFAIGDQPLVNVLESAGRGEIATDQLLSIDLGEICFLCGFEEDDTGMHRSSSAGSGFTQEGPF